MRDFYTKENMRGEAFHVPAGGLVFEPAQLSFETEAETGREGVIRIRHRDGKPARGYVYPSERCMRGVREQFAPAADGTGYIRWRFDARGIAAGRMVRGFFRVLSPYGEYRIPYEVRIAGKAPQGALPDAVRSREDFLALAQADFAQAAALFYSPCFEEILTDEGDRTLYRGLSMTAGNRQNVEEFLIAACGMEKAVYEPVEKELTLQVEGRRGSAEGRMAGSRAERALEAHRQRVREGSGIAAQAQRPQRTGAAPARASAPSPAREGRQEDLVYLPLHIRRTGTGFSDLVIRAEGRFLPAAPFGVPAPAGEEDVMTVRIPVDRTALHAGKNLGRIVLQAPFNEAQVPVEVHCTPAVPRVRRRQSLGLQQLEVQLMRLYVDYRLSGQAAGAWRRQAEQLIEALSLRSHGDLVPRLYGAHLHLLCGQAAEAARELSRIAVRYAGPEAAQNFTARFAGEKEGAYCYRQYLYARCHGEDAQLRGRTARFLKGVYRQSGDWRAAWMLMDLSEEYAPGTAARWNFLRHQYENGCSSPVMWLEAWDMVCADPQILLPGGSVQERWARDDFGLHVLWYAARGNALTARAAEVMALLAEKKKAFSPLLYRGLCAAYGMEAFSGRDPEGAAGGQDPVPEAPAEEQDSAPGAPEGQRDPAPEAAAGEQDPVPEAAAGQQEPVPEAAAGEQAPARGTGAALLRAICILLLRGQDLSPRAHRWYSAALDAGVNLTRLAESWEQSLPQDDAARRLPAGRNAILRTTARRAVRAVLLYDRFRREEAYPVRGGIAFLPVYGDANTVFLEDEAGNRYAKSLPYVLDIQGAAGPEEARGSLDGRAQRAEDLHALADRLGFGSRGASAFDATEESVREAGRLLDSGELTGPARTQILLECLSSGGVRDDPSWRSFLLQRADPAQSGDGARMRLLSFLEEAGEYGRAVRWLYAYGTEGADARLLGRICTGLSWEDADLSALVPLAWEAFLRGNREEALLDRLSAAFYGLSEELVRLREACADSGVRTAALDRRIVRQALYTGALTMAHAQVIAGAGRSLEEAFLPAAAQFADYAFSGGVMLGDRMTDLLTDLLAAGDGETADICRIAYLKELSVRQGDISEREAAAVRASLSGLLSRGIIFPFYRQFPGYDDRLDLYAEETLVQYHSAGPAGKDGRQVVFHYTTSRRGEPGSYRERPMKEMYRGFYVSGFLLFYGEQMHYYITDDAAGKNVVQSGVIGQDARIQGSCSGRFGLINETTRAAALREYDRSLELLEGYYRRSYLEGELFRR